MTSSPMRRGDQRISDVAFHLRAFIADKKRSTLLAQFGVMRSEAIKPALMLDPVLVDEVLDVSRLMRCVAKQPP